MRAARRAGAGAGAAAADGATATTTDAADDPRYVRSSSSSATTTTQRAHPRARASVDNYFVVLRQNIDDGREVTSEVVGQVRARSFFVGFQSHAPQACLLAKLYHACPEIIDVIEPDEFASAQRLEKAQSSADPLVIFLDDHHLVLTRHHPCSCAI